MNQSLCSDNQSLLGHFGDPRQRVEKAMAAVRAGQGVLLVDDEDRENKGDLIFAAEHLTSAQMALLIRECSGIVCLCLTDEKADSFGLAPIVADNDSRHGTAFTVSIEARNGVTTGVSASDRLRTIKTAVAASAAGRKKTTSRAMSFRCGPEEAGCWPAGPCRRGRSI